MFLSKPQSETAAPTTQRRVILIVMDSFGIGGARDAKAYGDQGANTLKHIFEACAKDPHHEKRALQGPLKLPNLESLGLLNAAKQSASKEMQAFMAQENPIGKWGFAQEISNGKDTPSGHFEIAGLPVEFDWGYFPKSPPCFDENLIDAIAKECAKFNISFSGVLGNKRASGLNIIKEFGEQHCATKLPIFYTSTDSVLQIAAHEEYFGLENLYKTCEIARARLDEKNIARIIARPFIGIGRDNFIRTGNRKDFSMPPHGKTLLDHIVESKNAVWAIGKISDIFAHQGISHQIKAHGHQNLMQETLKAMDKASAGDLIFTNFVEFDQSFGHRRDPIGYGNALEEFDAMLPALFAKLRGGDRVIFTADHGCDPTWHGTDHTRENVPILIYGKDILSGSIGERQSFADIGASIAHYLKISPLDRGKPFDF